MKKITVFLCVLLLEIIRVNAQEVNHFLAQAEQFYRQGNYQGAMLNYIAVLGHDSKNREAIIGLGDCSLALGDTAEAVNYYMQAINLYPFDLEAYKKLGDFYFLVGKDKKTLDIYRRAYLNNSSNSQALALLAVGYLLYGENDSADILINKLLDSNSEPQTFVLLAEGYSKIEKYDKAISFMDKAIELDPINDKLFYKKSKIEAQAQRYSDALKDVEKAINLNSAKKEYYIYLITLYYLDNKYAEAAQKAKALFDKVRDSSFYYLAVYSMWLDNEPIDTVFRYLDEAIDRTPSSSLWYLKGLILKSQTEYSVAAQSFKKALDIEPWDVDYTREYIMARLIANSKTLDKNLRFKNLNSFSIKQLKRDVRSKHSKYYYPKLKNKINERPLEAGFEDYLHLYVAPAFQKGYNPLDREIYYYTLDSLLNREKYNELFKQAYAILEKDPGNLAVYNILSVAYYQSHDLDKFRDNYTKYLGISLAIMATGKGTNTKTAMLSASQIDEILELNFIGYDQIFSPPKQEKNKKHHFNVYMTARNGQVQTYYFLTDLYFNKLLKD